MRPRFLADADLKRAIVAGVKRREPVVDFQTAQDAGLEGLNDPDVLAVAAQQGRILVSHDFEPCLAIFGALCPGKRARGVFLISQDSPIRVAVEALLLIWAASDFAEWENHLTYLPF